MVITIAGILRVYLKSQALHPTLWFVVIAVNVARSENVIIVTPPQQNTTAKKPDFDNLLPLLTQGSGIISLRRLYAKEPEVPMRDKLKEGN